MTSPSPAATISGQPTGTAAPSIAPGSSTPGPSSSGSPAPTTATPGTSFPAGTGFLPLDTFPATGAFEIDDVAVTSSGFMAVGFGGLNGEDYYGRRQGIVWTSVDGVNWVETVDASLQNVSPNRIVARGSDYFMLGVISSCPQLSEEDCFDVPQAGNGIFHSTDGVVWTLLPQLPDMQYGLIDDLFLAGDRLVAFGSSADENQTTSVWQSADGAAWTATTNVAGLEQISAMTFGNNMLVGFGTRYVNEFEDVVMTTASSTDGASFTPGNLPELIGSAIDGVVLGSNGFAGVGYESSEVLEISGVALHSADGVTWSQATNSDGTWAGSGLEFVAALPTGGFVAVGFAPQEDFTLQDFATWHSADGTDWTLLHQLPGSSSQLMAAVLGGPGMVVFAADQTEDDEGNLSSAPRAWFAPISELGV